MKPVFKCLFIFFACLFPFSSFSQTSPTPDQALNALKEGNRRSVEGKATHPHQGAERRKDLTQGQTPFAVIVSCSDSRVPPELIFDQGLGDLFIVRVAGNSVDEVALGSIEYAVNVLHSPFVVVLGHEHCGAVEAALKEKPLPGHIPTVAQAIAPALKTKDCKKDSEPIECAVGANVNFVVGQLKSSEPILAPLVKSGKLKVVGALYHLDSGKVDFSSPK